MPWQPCVQAAFAQHAGQCLEDLTTLGDADAAQALRGAAEAMGCGEDSPRTRQVDAWAAAVTALFGGANDAGGFQHPAQREAYVLLQVRTLEPQEGVTPLGSSSSPLNNSAEDTSLTPRRLLLLLPSSLSADGAGGLLARHRGGCRRHAGAAGGRHGVHHGRAGGVAAAAAADGRAVCQGELAAAAGRRRCVADAGCDAGPSAHHASAERCVSVLFHTRG